MAALGWLLNLGFSGSGAVAVFTITFPDAIWDGNGQAPEVIVKNVTSSTNEVSLIGATVNSVQQTIDGSTSLAMNTAYWIVHGISDGTNWMRVD